MVVAAAVEAAAVEVVLEDMEVLRMQKVFVQAEVMVLVVRAV